MVIVVTYQVCHHPLTDRREPLALNRGPANATGVA
jgi:hypothetical protein